MIATSSSGSVPCHASARFAPFVLKRSAQYAESLARGVAPRLQLLEPALGDRRRKRGLIIAAVVQRARRGPVGKLAGGNEIPPDYIDGIDI